MASMLHDKGGQYLLQTAFSEEQTPPVNFYLMLYNDTPAVTDAIADLASEPATNHYERQTVASTAVGCVIAVDVADYMVTFLQVTFDATGGSWGPVSHAAIVTSADGSGKLIASWELSTPRTLQDGDTLLLTGKIKVT